MFVMMGHLIPLQRAPTITIRPCTLVRSGQCVKRSTLTMQPVWSLHLREQVRIAQVRGLRQNGSSGAGTQLPTNLNSQFVTGIIRTRMLHQEEFNSIDNEDEDPQREPTTVAKQLEFSGLK
ncbi:hypothetical protein KIN20_007335 [Parelaphostrongylus tenuis]|uniref:Uncharacterized protein n=1 Tax=Parelaphostrongylus tenuis TaxID=148309 RepID=A0AAD5M382_PARTN|nr:hypothetical protein KIN20_007335 [Parelaphostrongylus tenuis]